MLQRYEFDNRTSGGVLEFASFDEGQAHHRKRSVYKFTYNVLALVVACTTPQMLLIIWYIYLIALNLLGMYS